jgi:hypothetical protein
MAIEMPTHFTLFFVRTRNCDFQRNSMPRWGRLTIGLAGAVEFEQLPVVPG